MSDGLFLSGDNSSLLVTTESESLVFIGKATFVSRQGITGAGFGPLYNSTTGITLYNWPQASIYNFTFASAGKDAVYFVYAPYPYKASISGVERVSGTDTIYVTSQPAGSTTFVPTVYAFAAASVAQTSGYGVNVFKSDGTPAFTTADNIMFANKIYSSTAQASNIQPLYAPNGITYVGNGPNYNSATISYIAPTASDGAAIAKPIIYFPAPQTAVARNFGSQRYFYELAAAYNPTSSDLELEWVNSFFGFSSSTATFNVPSLPFFAMVADGALYD
jgi:hypothetical protein